MYRLNAKTSNIRHKCRIYVLTLVLKINLFAGLNQRTWMVHDYKATLHKAHSHLYTPVYELFSIHSQHPPLLDHYNCKAALWTSQIARFARLHHLCLNQLLNFSSPSQYNICRLLSPHLLYSSSSSSSLHHVHYSLLILSSTLLYKMWHKSCKSPQICPK